MPTSRWSSQDRNEAASQRGPSVMADVVPSPTMYTDILVAVVTWGLAAAAATAFTLLVLMLTRD